MLSCRIGDAVRLGPYVRSCEITSIWVTVRAKADGHKQCAGELGSFAGTKVLEGDYFFEVTCLKCAGGKVRLTRLKMSWYASGHAYIIECGLT